MGNRWIKNHRATKEFAEILIADHADEHMASESLRIRVRIPLREIDVRKAENAAMKRAGRICGDIERYLTSNVPSAGKCGCRR